MPTLPPYLELAEAAYRQLPADKLNDLVKGLCRLAESWQAHDPQRAGALWDEALALSGGDPRQFGAIEISDAMSTLAAHTPRPADLQALEARNHALAQDFISDSLTTDLVQAWLRLGQPEQAARCLDDYLQLPEDCIDPAEPAQLTLLMQKPQLGFSCRAIDAVAGGYRTRSSRQ